MQDLHDSANLDTLAARTIKLGRDLAYKARALDLGRNAKEAAFVARCLAPLETRQAFNSGDEASFAAIQGILENDLAGEIIETEQRFVETHFNELGQQGEVRELPIYSSRGLELLDLSETLDDFMATRAAVLDHIAAHQALMTLMSG